MSVAGLARIRAALAALAAAAPEAAAKALYAEAEDIMADAKGRTPVDTGALQASGHVQPPAVSATRVTVTLGFGGAAVPYAAIVHEDLHAHHTVGEAKFLERAVDAARNGMEARLAAALEAALKGQAKP